MKLLMNTAITKMSETLDVDYPTAVGLFMLFRELDKTGELDTLNTDRLLSKLGYLSQQTSRKLSQKKREEMCEILRETEREIKRENDRERQREYYERKRRSLSSPLSPIPSLPPIIPPEKERENDPPRPTDETPKGVAPTKNDTMTLSRKVFKKPTRDEVAAYALEIDYNLDTDAFMDFYTANGWKAGKNPMRDWKATVRNWQRRDKERGLNTHAKHPGPPEHELTAEELAAIEEVYARNGRDAYM